MWSCCFRVLLARVLAAARLFEPLEVWQGSAYIAHESVHWNVQISKAKPVYTGARDVKEFRWSIFAAARSTSVHWWYQRDIRTEPNVKCFQTERQFELAKFRPSDVDDHVWSLGSLRREGTWPRFSNEQIFSRSIFLKDRSFSDAAVANFSLPFRSVSDIRWKYCMSLEFRG
jgi:hypothetical protein